ncbi:MAG: hypothetical protein IK064_02595 [Clostridia bacterium]|nr:hypothetical protein [Clostridia bacterium]
MNAGTEKDNRIGERKNKLFARGRKTAACALCLALIAVLPVSLALAACKGEGPAPVKPGTTAAPTAEARSTPDAGHDPEMPVGTSSPMELPYTVPEGKQDSYYVCRLIFGAEGDGQSAVEPFTVSFLLPNGWTVEPQQNEPEPTGDAESPEQEPESEFFIDIRGVSNPLKGALYFLDEEGRRVGAVGFSSYYTHYDPIRNYYQIYSSVVYGNYRFLIDRSYHPFFNSEASNITAITQTVYSEETEEGTAVRFNPAVVAHDPERGVFIAAEFLSDGIDPIELIDLAESLRIY